MAPDLTPPLSTLVLWLKADQLGLANGASVSLWQDQSGLSNDVTQSTAANQPTFVSSGINGHPSVSFDGVNDVLARTTAVDINQRDWTIFAALQTNSTTQPQIAVYNGKETNGWGMMPRTNVASRGGIMGSVAFMSDGATTTSPEVYCLQNTSGPGSSTTAFYLNGTAQTLSNSTAFPLIPSAVTSVGADDNGSGTWQRFMSGYIGEILIYASSLSSTDRDTVTNYLRAKFGI